MTFDTNNDNGFGFIAGQAPEFSDQGSDVGLSTILEGVAILLDWRKRAAFQTDVTVRLGNDSRNYHVTARPRELSYEVASVETGTVESFDPRSGMIREGTSERPLEPYQIGTEPMAVRLAFPVSLGIWGRPGDSYRMTGARRTADQLVVALVHQADPSLTGELVIDLGRRKAVRLDTPTLGIEYRDIQPAH